MDLMAWPYIGVDFGMVTFKHGVTRKPPLKWCNLKLSVENMWQHFVQVQGIAVLSLQLWCCFNLEWCKGGFIKLISSPTTPVPHYVTQHVYIISNI